MSLVCRFIFFGEFLIFLRLLSDKSFFLELLQEFNLFPFNEVGEIFSSDHSRGLLPIAEGSCQQRCLVLIFSHGWSQVGAIIHPIAHSRAKHLPVTASGGCQLIFLLLFRATSRRWFRRNSRDFFWNEQLHPPLFLFKVLKLVRSHLDLVFLAKCSCPEEERVVLLLTDPASCISIWLQMQSPTMTVLHSQLMTHESRQNKLLVRK